MKKAFVLAGALALAACGGGGGSGSTTSNESGSADHAAQPAPAEGRFLDSAVEGLWYETDSQSGYTSPDGSFSYVPGEYVRFYLGATFLGEVLAQAEITPLDLITATDSPDKLQNILRLLQTFDADADPENGITIDPATRAYLDEFQLPIDSPALLLEADNAVQAAISVLTNGTGLRDAVDAFTHFRETMLSLRRAGDENPLLNLIGTTWDATLESTACPSVEPAVLTYRFNVLGIATTGHHRLNEESCEPAGLGIFFDTYETNEVFTCASQCLDADLNRVMVETVDGIETVTAINYNPVDQTIVIRVTRDPSGENVTTTQVLTKRPSI